MKTVPGVISKGCTSSCGSTPVFATLASRRFRCVTILATGAAPSSANTKLFRGRATRSTPSSAAYSRLTASSCDVALLAEVCTY